VEREIFCRGHLRDGPGAVRLLNRGSGAVMTGAGVTMAAR